MPGKNEKLNGVLFDRVKHLAATIARRIPHNYCDEDDLLQEGLLAIELAKQTYRHSKKCSFRTYAMHRVRYAMYDYLRRIDIMPRTMRARVKQYMHLKSAHLTDEQIAKKIRAKQKLVAKTAQASRFEFIELSCFEKDDEQRLQLPCSNGERFKRIDDADELQQLIMRTELGRDEYLVLMLKYYESMTYSEIGQVLGVQKTRVFQLHKSAITKLRAAKTTIEEHESSKNN